MSHYVATEISVSIALQLKKLHIYEKEQEESSLYSNVEKYPKMKKTQPSAVQRYSALFHYKKKTLCMRVCTHETCGKQNNSPQSCPYSNLP